MKHKLLTSLAIAALAAVGAAQSPLFRAQILPSEIRYVGGMNTSGWMVVQLRSDLPQRDITLWHPDFGFVYRDVPHPTRRFLAGSISDQGMIGGALESFEWFTQGDSTLRYYQMARVDTNGVISTYNVDILTDGGGMSFLANSNAALYTDRNGTATFRADGSWRSEIPVGFGTRMNRNGQVLTYMGGAYRRVEVDGSFMAIPLMPGSGHDLGPDGKVAISFGQSTTRLYSASGLLTHTFSFDFPFISFIGPDQVIGGLMPWVQIPGDTGHLFQDPTLAVWSPLTGRVIVHDSLINPIPGLKLALKNFQTNYAGTLVTEGVLNGQRVNVLLTPVPEPATLTALALGLVACLRRKKKVQS